MATRRRTRPEQYVRAWRPPVPGVAEVLHARFVDHAYPPHVHDVWTLMLIDTGAVRYDLDRRGYGADPGGVTILPPYVVHDGRAAVPAGFRKRVLYLDPAVLGDGLIGRAVDRPTLTDPVLRRRLRQLHDVLADPGEILQAESRLALIGERLRDHLGATDPGTGGRVPGWRLARDLRDLLDAETVTGVGLAEASATLEASPTHLIRSFTAAYGLPPHAYLTGRRVERARRLLLAGRPPSEVADAAGFYDQAHLTRHFRRYLGTTPARYAISPPGRRRPPDARTGIPGVAN